MGLVDYSDSDASEPENRSPVKAHSSKSTFQKVVDRSNPGKIRVSLPQNVAIDDSNEGPPAKRAKMGSGALGGFNSFLPAPKRTGAIAGAASGGLKGARSGGLGAGVNLKTGAAPGFSRDSEYEVDGPAGREAQSETTEAPDENIQKQPATDKLIGKPLMFKPLSVARKVAKKKPSSADGTLSKPTSQDREPTYPKQVPPTRQPKVSLFSMTAGEDDTSIPTTDRDYQPLIYGLAAPEGEQEAENNPGTHLHESMVPSNQASFSSSTQPGAQSLEDIASDLGLSSAERRQLFGRQKGPKSGGIPSATNIINFNTDKEYQHNEELRASGEQVVHREVTAIAPGKHSLKQLVNAAVSQKEALEDSFTRGKSNRTEASSRYGW